MDRLDQAQLPLDDPGHLPQRLQLGLIQAPGPVVGDAEGADLLPVRAVERVAGVEPDVRIAGHERVIAEPYVLGGVGYDHRLVRQDGVPAEGDGAGSLGRVSDPCRKTT